MLLIITEVKWKRLHVYFANILKILSAIVGVKLEGIVDDSSIVESSHSDDLLTVLDDFLGAKINVFSFAW